MQLATDILTFVALAYSWNLISGFTGYVSFGQVTFFGMGAYATALMVLHTPIPWYLAIPIAVLLAGMAALLLGAVMLRLRGIMFALGMLGLARILAVIAANWSFAGGAVGLTLPAQLTPIAVYAGTWAVALYRLRAQRVLHALGTGAERHERARRRGGRCSARGRHRSRQDPDFRAQRAGAGRRWRAGRVEPELHRPYQRLYLNMDLQLVVFTLFGGIGTLWGPLLGTLVLMLVGQQLWAYVPELQLALYGGLVIVVVLAFPGGMVGLANRFGWLLRRPIFAPRSFPAAIVPPPAPPSRPPVQRSLRRPGSLGAFPRHRRTRRLISVSSAASR